MSEPFKSDGLFLHASSVVIDGGALLFLGHSTAGKSTLARLLGATLPVLADDAVYAARGPEGIWRVVDGSFRFGRDDETRWPDTVRRRAAAASAVPLRACLRIHKAAETRIAPLAPVELARGLLDAAMEIDVQRKFGRPKPGAAPESREVETVRRMRRQWFQWVAEIARACPGWNLWFSKEALPEALFAALAKTTREHGNA